MFWCFFVDEKAPFVRLHKKFKMSMPMTSGGFFPKTSGRLGRNVVDYYIRKLSLDHEQDQYQKLLFNKNSSFFA